MGKPPYGRHKSRSANETPTPGKRGGRGRAHPEIRCPTVYARRRGGVDWSSPIIAEALLRLAFHAIDRMPRGPRVYSLLRRIEMGVYNRMTVLVTESYAESGPPPFAPVWELEGPEAHFGDVAQQ